MSHEPFAETTRHLVAVAGSLAPEEAGITDAHNHVWIATVPGALPGTPVLDDSRAILAELIDYRQVGGGTIVDCQPGGCGRDGRVLQQLSCASAISVVACTGFHLQKYYPPEHWLYAASAQDAHAYFIRELTEALEETRALPQPVRAGFIKIACEANLEESPAALLEAAVAASVETGAAIEAHTQQGADVERIVSFMLRLGLKADWLVLCHMDKRPDFELHRSLAQAGVMLEYDTFFRPKYRPDEGVWPLLERMVAAGLEGHIALATDMADRAMWKRLGGGPGLTGLLAHIIPRVEAMGFAPETVRRLTGENIADRLARPLPQLA